MGIEDFGYMIEKEKHQNKFLLAKKPLKLAAVLISSLSFILITISAYYFVSQGRDKNIELVESPNYEIKVRNKESNSKIKNIDSAIYNNIVGKKKDDFKNNNIKVIKTPKSAKPQNPTQTVKQNPASILKTTKSQIAEEKINIISDKEDLGGNKRYSRVQLAALKSKTGGYQYWLRLRKQHPELFFGLKHYVQRVDLGKRGIFYRLQVGNFSSQVRAEEFCVKFIAKTRKSKSDCIIVE